MTQVHTQVNDPIFTLDIVSYRIALSDLYEGDQIGLIQGIDEMQLEKKKTSTLHPIINT